MQIATINKINDKLKISDIFEAHPKDVELIQNYAYIDDATKYYYNTLLLNNIIYVKEEAFLKKVLTKDSFIIIPKEKIEGNEKTESEELEIEKNKILTQLDRFLSNNINKFEFLKFIQYISYFNYFASKGIFITEENKEDKYIEILELDDEQAINKLEKYLTIQDELKLFILKNEKISDIKEEIEYADENEIKQIQEDIDTGKAFRIEM